MMRSLVVARGQHRAFASVPACNKAQWRRQHARSIGVFEIRDDKFAVWRDYSDLAQFAVQMPAPAA